MLRGSRCLRRAQPGRRECRRSGSRDARALGGLPRLPRRPRQPARLPPGRSGRPALADKHFPSGVVLVMATHPELRIALWLVASLGREVEQLIGAIDRVDSAGVSRVRVEDLTRLVLEEHTEALAIWHSWLRRAVVIDGGMVRERLGRERDAEVIVKVR